MPHHLQSFLDEYQFAINHLAPTVPDEVKEQAQSAYDALLANENATEEEILSAVVKTGMAEYPYRHAFADLTDVMAEEKRLELVLEHVDESVANRLKKHLDAGVALDAIISSDLFETGFTAEERYQVEHAILDAKDHVAEAIRDGFDKQAPKYLEAIKKHEKYRDQIAKKIDELELLEEKDEKWKEEIEEKVKRFREGFAVTERDVELEEVEKEIEYWVGVFGEDL
jgi:hypothetical protein